MGRVTDRLAHFVTATKSHDVPAVVMHEAKRSLMNFFATALAGCNDTAVARASAVLGKFAGTPTATVIGRCERRDMLNAACLNAMSANVFDFDDTHVPTIIHPTAPVAPALFAWAESSRLSGLEFLLAFVLGVEIECRLGNAISPWHYQRGWHITSTCGIFGATAAVGKAIGLDAMRLRWALGNASAQSSGLVETLGTMAKSIGVGNSARNGLLSALLAQQDFAGPTEPLAGERGFLRVMGQDASLGALDEALGERWEILANTYKPYPCGVVLNPVIEACLSLANEYDVRLEDVERVEIVAQPLLRQRTDRPPPASGREAQVNAQHSVAVALTRKRAGLAEFSDAAAANPSLRAFADRVHFLDDENYPIEAARVTLRMRSDDELSTFVQCARGSSARPLSDDDLERKLVELIEYGRSGCKPRPLIDTIWALDRNDNVAQLLTLAAGNRDVKTVTC